LKGRNPVLEGVRARLLAFARGGLKRGFDIAASSVLILVLLVPLAIIALLIFCDSPGPVFYQAERVGRRWRRLSMLKFRTMRCDVDGPRLTVEGDPRFTRVGRVLAKAKVDELPQLWNVLRGEMSLIGPRPQSPEFAECFRKDYDYVLSVRPGMTGLTQVAFANENGVLQREDPVRYYIKVLLPQKLKLDRMYVTRGTLWFDLRIIFWTVVAAVLQRPVAVHRASAKMNLRKRPDPLGPRRPIEQHVPDPVWGEQPVPDPVLGVTGST
jgi:lipopolysaccharide/colanic/teichoic acid biosynthesis glycosyltransferase